MGPLLGLQVGKQVPRALVLDGFRGLVVEGDGMRFRLPGDGEPFPLRVGPFVPPRFHPFLPGEPVQVDEIRQVLFLPVRLERGDPVLRGELADVPLLLLREEGEQIPRRGIPLTAGQPLVKRPRLLFVCQGDLQDFDLVQVQHRDGRPSL